MEMPSFPALEGCLNTDVLIVGGGLAGLLCAHRLSRNGVSCAVIERERICGGVTARTTAKLTSQHGLVYSKLLKKYGAGTARAYWELNEAALGEFRRLGAETDCDFQTRDHAVYDTGMGKALEEEGNALSALGIPFGCPRELPLPFPVTGAIRFRDQAQFHPLKFAAGIAEGLTVYEGTAAREFAPHRVVTDQGEIRAEKIILATHFPILNKHGGYFLKLYQQRSYVLAVENAMDVGGMYLAAEEGGFSFRNHGAALLIGQGGHRTGKKSDGWQKLNALVQEKYPKGKVVARWANQDCMTLDGLPYVGQYSRRTPELYVAAGFNKWGMTGSMAAAMLLTDQILGRENPYEELFSPRRSSMHSQLLYNGVESAVNLLTPTKPRCPHLGCALKWNPWERSWDCPCHGSRFSEKGKLLNDPATGDLTEE